MIKISVTFNSSHIQPTNAYDRSLAFNTLDLIKRRLSPFEKEIDASDGKIEVNFTNECLDSSICFSGFPDDLSQKMKQALGINSL